MTQTRVPHPNDRGHLGVGTVPGARLSPGDHMQPTPAEQARDARAGRANDYDHPTCPGWWCHQPRGKGVAPRLVLVSGDLSMYRPERGVSTYSVPGDTGRWLGFAGPSALSMDARRQYLAVVTSDIDPQVHAGLTKAAERARAAVGALQFAEAFGLELGERDGHHELDVEVRNGLWATPTGEPTASRSWPGIGTATSAPPPSSRRRSSATSSSPAGASSRPR